MWRDELHSWMISKNSTSIVNLFENTKYEGHPILWYLVLYVITRFVENPLSMQIFHLLISSASLFVFLRFSPFTKLQKTLFAFGYFPLFEYAAISRNYSIGILMIFVFCALYKHHATKWLLLSMLLFILMQTSIYGVIIALALTFFLIIDSTIHKNINFNYKIIACGFVLITGLLLSIYKMVPPPDSGIVTGWRLNFSIKAIGNTMLAIWQSYVPIPNINLHFWGSNIISSKLLQLILSVMLLFIGILIFHRKPKVLFLYLCGTLMMLLFMYVKYFGFMRHHGHLFILFIACLWISHYFPETKPNRSIFSANEKGISFVLKHCNLLIILILSTHVAAGIYSSVMDWIYPFSASKETAMFIQNNKLDKELILGYYDPSASTVAGYLDAEIFYLSRERYAKFIVWDNHYKEKTVKEIIEIAKKISANSKKKVLFVFSERVENISDYPLKKIGEFTQSIVESECFYLYLLNEQVKHI